MKMWEWYEKNYDRDQRRQELTALANQPSMLDAALQVTQNWLDRRWTNYKIVKILDTPDYEREFWKWLKLESVD